MLIILSCGLLMLANAYADGNENLFTQSHILSSGLSEDGVSTIKMIDWVGDSCYAYCDNNSIYIYQPGNELTKYCQLPDTPEAMKRDIVIVDDKLIQQLQDLVTHIVSDQTNLYGFNVYNGMFGLIDHDGIHWQTVAMDMECLRQSNDIFPNYVTRSLLTENSLYTFVLTEEGQLQFWGFDRITGVATEYNVPHAVSVCYGYEDHFLFLCQDENGYHISRLDTLNNSLSDMDFPLSSIATDSIIGGIAYDSQSNELYFSMNGKVYRSAEHEEFEPIAFIPTEYLMMETPAWVLQDGRYAQSSLSGVYVRTTSEQAERQQLVVRTNVWTPFATSLFQQNHPEIELALLHEPITAEEVAQMVILQDASIDIFEISTDYSFSTLVQKGFAAKLSSSDQLRNEVEAMEPIIASVLENEQGDLVAYPSQLRLWSTSVHEGYWKMVFGDRPFPTTMDEFLDAWIDYETDYADLYPELQFCISLDFQEYCEKIITFYAQQNDHLGELSTVNAPELSNALKKLTEIIRLRQQAGRYTSVNELLSEEGMASMFRFRGWDSAMYELPSSGALVAENTLYDMYIWDYKKIPLRFSANDTLQTDGTLYVYVVNPYSTNQEAAIQYLECVAALESEPYIYYATHPDCNDPYENPDFEHIITSVTQSKNVLEEALSMIDASDIDKADDIQAMIDFYDTYLQNAENERWMISAETIAVQREMMENLNLHTESIFNGATGSKAEGIIVQLCKRYVDGNVTIDMLLRELDAKLNMMKLENN